MTEEQVTPAPAESAEPAPAAAETSVTPPEAPKEPTIPKSRFDEVYRRWRDTERELMAFKQPKEPEKPVNAPKLSDFEFDEAKYQAALVEYTKSEARREALEVIKAEKQRGEEQERMRSFKQRETDFITKTPDYAAKVYDPANTFFTEDVARLIAESEDGPAVAYHLANNPEKAWQIANLPPTAAAREIGRIEAGLAKKPEAPKPLTQAPPPPPTIEAVEPAVEKDPLKMSDAEFAKWRKRQIAQRR